MILLFGGTTEGKRVANYLNTAQLDYIYSTKTTIEFEGHPNAQYRYGAFTEDDLATFIDEKTVKLILDASHPFASQLHQTIAEVAFKRSIPVIRFERVYFEKVIHPKIHYVSSFEAAIEKLYQLECYHLLALTGVQSIVPLKPYWFEKQVTFRILPRESSIQQALQTGLAEKNILTEMPGQGTTQEIQLIQNLRVDCILTKNSGESGFLSSKIEAAIQTQTNLIIVERPTVPESFQIVYTEQELAEQLKTLYL
ncbi:precorrin-6A reductase [Cytophagaceae bacterium DM2B3-1]|uniref:Precorrin-6A reductase n=1 Tax=Xanthocytophaga flava TaxID=3048013 RepID=A0ABT7CW95_9BACT|nr:precorrin-6A reductase [Xanthocytophaga flavus]MDJ1498045.1 precorrin-6A reductase [Xanthocytophaga flavus]